MRPTILSGVVILTTAGSGWAQSDTGLILEAPATLSPAQPSITVHLWAEFPAADYAFAEAHFDVLASEPTASASKLSRWRETTPAGWSDPRLVLLGPGASAGVIRAGRIEGIVAGQLNFPPRSIYADPTNPIEVWTAEFTVTDFTPRTISIMTNTALFEAYPLKDSWRSEPRASHEALHEVRVIRACPADCDGDGELTFFDFLCFQNLFAAGDPGADCDGDGSLTFFDFLCFQNEFAAGCS